MNKIADCTYWVRAKDRFDPKKCAGGLPPRSLTPAGHDLPGLPDINEGRRRSPASYRITARAPMRGLKFPLQSQTPETPTRVATPAPLVPAPLVPATPAARLGPAHRVRSTDAIISIAATAHRIYVQGRFGSNFKNFSAQSRLLPLHAEPLVSTRYRAAAPSSVGASVHSVAWCAPTLARCAIDTIAPPADLITAARRW